MAAVMIGVDPHKGSHTAVVISAAEQPLGELCVGASAGQAGKLVAWAVAWPERTWAVEGAAGLGYLLAQQLVAAGEQVLDVQPKLAARVLLLQSGDTNKNDPNDALSVAVAALRSTAPRLVRAEDCSAVLKVWAKRHRDLARARNQVACRLHAVLCDLVPGGHRKEISAAQAARILEKATPSGAVALARAELAAEFLTDLRHLDAQLRLTKKKLAAAVRASGISLTEVFGVGPVIAGTIAGDCGDVSRFPSRDHFAAYNGTAPVEVSSGPRKICRLSPRGKPAPQPRHPHGRDHPDQPPAQRRPRVLRQEADRGKTHKEAVRCLKRRISDAVFARLQADARQASASQPVTGPGGQPGNDSASSAAGSHPARQLFGQATPGPGTSLRPSATTPTPSPSKRTSKKTRPAA